MNINIEGTNLYLCKGVELDPNYEYSIDFEDVAAQKSYFEGKKTNTIPSGDYSQIRDGVVSVDISIEELRAAGVNYLYFTLPPYRTYYAFINHIEWVSDSTTKIYYDIDVMQTYMFDYEIKESFIEREHQDRLVNVNGVIKPRYNLQEENINYGSEYNIEIYKNAGVRVKNMPTPDKNGLLFVYAILISKSGAHMTDMGLPLGSEIRCCIKYDDTSQYALYNPIYIEDRNSLSDPKPFIEFMETSAFINKYKQNPSCYEIFVSKIPPFAMTAEYDEGQIKVNIPHAQGENDYILDGDNMNANIIITSRHTAGQGLELITQNGSWAYKQIVYEKPDINNLANIKNETKLRTYPYNFNKLYFGNSELVIKNEYVTSDSGQPSIKLYQSFSSEASAGLLVEDYLGGSSVDNNHLLVNQMPNYIDLETDAWKTYMLQNKAQRTAGFISEGVKLGVSLLGLGASAVASGGLSIALGAGAVGVAANSALQINNQLAKEKDIKQQPVDLKQFNGDTSLTRILTNFSHVQMIYDIQPEFKELLYKYFSHYGYKCNNFKVPDVKSRYYFNYIKTIGINLSTTTDAETTAKLKDIYNNGVTLWHFRDPATWKGVNNYEYENAEMALLTEVTANE